MIRPDLGTMIAIVTTDAAIAADQLQPLLAAAAARSFNRITVDGSQSTSDSVIVLASGASGVAIERGRTARRVRRGAARRLPRPRARDRVRRRGRPADRPVRGGRRPLLRRCRPRRAARRRGPAGALRAVRRRPELGPDRGRARRRAASTSTPTGSPSTWAACRWCATGSRCRAPPRRPARRRRRVAGRRADRPRGRRRRRRSSTAPTCRPSTSSTTRSTRPDAPVVAKLGGNALGLAARTRSRSARGGRQLVHRPRRRRADLGADARRGIEPRFVGGRRFTDLPSLACVRKALADVSDELAAAIAAAGGRAAAAPARRGPGRRADARAGAGRPHQRRGDGAPFEAAWAAAGVPLVAPVARDGTGDRYLNVNADDVAAAVAAALAPTSSCSCPTCPACWPRTAA